jgi:7-cyano-7-deazaguanine synthase in queuosine biosynthesis
VSAHRLLLRAGSKQLQQLSTDDFLWQPYSEPSSMETNLSPRLEELGPVPPPHVDLVRLAVLVFLTDRSVCRDQGPGVRWDRDLSLTVPVSDADVWTTAADALEYHLHVLTGDRWTLAFEQERPRKKRSVAEVEPAPIVCLFSGGADSFAGAVAAHAKTGVPPVLVSHWDFSEISGVQNNLVRRLEKLWGTGPEHERIEVTRWSRQVGSGSKFRDEKSRRSRSLLFLSLGLAVAAARGAELWMSENGFTSINPPLAPERRGSLTTRTTHPAFLGGLTETARAVGLTVRLLNPFDDQTKGAVIRDCAASLPKGNASSLLSATHSCGKPSWFPGYRQSHHCGLCFGCLVRRGAFVAAGVKDRTLYIEEDLRGDSRRQDFASGTRMKTVQATRYRLRRGYDERDILSLGLPDRIPVRAAVQLVNDGLRELGPVVRGLP